MIWFILVSFVASGIIYGIRGNSNIAYIDCLFIAASGMTVTGLVTFPVSQLTLAQQIVVFILMSIGNLIIDSVVIVLLRRYFFGKKFRSVVKESASVRERMRDIENQQHKHHEGEMEWVRSFFGLRHNDHDTHDPQDAQAQKEKRKQAKTAADKSKGHGSAKRPKLHAGMVHRMDEPARQVNPTGQMTTMVANPEPVEFASPVLQGSNEPAMPSILQTSDAAADANDEKQTPTVRIAEPTSDAPEQGVRIVEPEPPSTDRSIRIAEPAAEGNESSVRIREPRRDDVFSSSASPSPVPQRRRSTSDDDRPKEGKEMRRVHTVSFLEQTPEQKQEHEELRPKRAATLANDNPFPSRSLSFARTNTMQTRSDTTRAPHVALHRTMTRNKNKGLGGFPSPLEWIVGFLESFNVNHRLKVPRSATMASAHPDRMNTIESDRGGVRLAPYLTFDATVTGNSHFHNLTQAQRNELGGVEYRAVDVLAWLIPAYWIAWVLLAIIITTPYMVSKSAQSYRDAIEDQPKPPHNTTWFWIFTVVSAITNTGMSLADESFQGALRNGYMMLIPTAILVLVGNTAYPVMLRFFIWLLSCCVHKESHLYETLRFLLDHPRRCFVYLFPRENTWFLFALVIILTFIDWFFLLVLDLEMRHEWPSIGTWVFDALFQSVAVRSGGFQTFNILNLVPAEQMLQVFMMYLAVFPLTMAVRSTNVYEEGSLGVYDDEGQQDESSVDDGHAVWGRFLSEQVRRQVAFDLWWMALALWIVLIAEKGKIGDHERYPNLTVFTVLYEMVSAYGTVGLSCGAQNMNASLSGDFGVISKLIVIAVMIRGRHRGLPSAIDRAIMLPSELHAYDQTHDAHLNVPNAGLMASYPTAGSDKSWDDKQDAGQSTGVRTTFADDDGLQRISSRPNATFASTEITSSPETTGVTPTPVPSKPASVHSM